LTWSSRSTGLPVFAVDELPMDPMAGRAVQGVKGDPFGLGCRRVQRHGAGQLADLQETFPVRAWGHVGYSARAL